MSVAVELVVPNGAPQSRLVIIKPSKKMTEIWKELDELISEYRSCPKVNGRYLVMTNSLAGLNLDMAEASITDIFCAMDKTSRKKFRDLTVNLLRAKGRATDISCRKEVIDDLRKRISALE